MQFDISKPPGSRVRSLQILCTDCRVPRYQPVEDAELYTVVMPEYLVSGGDGYAVIADEMIKHNSGEMLGGRGVLVASAEPSSLFFSICRRLGRFRRVHLHQPTQAGLSSRGRTDQLLQLCCRTGMQHDAGFTGITGTAVDRLRRTWTKALVYVT